MEACEMPMWIAAAVAVAMFESALSGRWATWGLLGPYPVVSVAIDVLILIDIAA
jgi:hypothetical protein